MQYTQKYDNISQPSSNINSINQGYYPQPVMNYPGMYYNNTYQYPYPFMPNQNYMQQTSQNYYNPLISDSSQQQQQQQPRTKIEKRESKPLTVIDPTKNEVLDLNKISKSKNILIDEIKQSDQNKLIPDLMICKESTNFEDGKLEMPIISVSVAPVIEEVEEDIKPQILEKLVLKTNISNQSIKQSHSIPNKLANLSEEISINPILSSSETDLYLKTNSKFSEILYDNERKIYNRDSLIEIGKSIRSQKLPSSLEKFECKEIINATFYGKNRRKIINIGSPKTGSLSRIVNGYLPPHLRLKEECSINKNLENCRRNLKCILNKIAPQNFPLCINEIKTIIKSSDQQNVNIDDCIDCLIEEIFDKAVKEEAYSVTYANLCFNIAKLDDVNESKWNFKSSLLNRCKQMFETPLQDQLRSVKEHWEKKVEEELDEKMKNLYRSDIEEQIKKARDKYFGNIRFIGELYVHDLLKPKIINCCVTTLLPKTTDEDAMLSLCKLLETCGKKFDEKHGEKMSDYIKRMNEMLETDQFETRIRFKILDIIEMSERKWLLREIQSQKMVRPKTLEEVKKDISDDKSISTSKFPNSKSINRNSTKNIQNQSELKFKQQNRNQSIDLNSLSLGQNENLELKPSYGLWNSHKEKDQSEWKNVDSKKRTKSKFTSTKQHAQNRFSPNKITDEPSNKTHSSKYAYLIGQDDIKDNNIISSESPVRSASPCESKSEDDTVMLMDGEELLDNLLETHTLNMTAWCNQLKVSELINQWLDKIMEKKQRDRHLVGDQLANLVACNKLQKDALIEGLNQFVDLIDDLITDIPKIWTFLAELLERFIQDENSYVEFFKIVFESRLPNKNINECIFLIFEFANERVGNSVIKSLIDNKLEDLLEFMKKNDDINHLFVNHNLTFLLDAGDNVDNNLCDNVENNAEDNLSSTPFTDSFKNELISNLPNDNEYIFELLESKFTIEQMQTDEFVNSLAYCLFAFICDLNSKTDIIDFLIEKQCFFRRFIDSKSTFETQFLLALVNFANRLEERDLLVTLVQNLTGKIISTDACQHFINNSEFKNIDLRNNNENYQLTVDAIRSILENEQR